jgi:hypothetical protein
MATYVPRMLNFSLTLGKWLIAVNVVYQRFRKQLLKIVVG